MQLLNYVGVDCSVPTNGVLFQPVLNAGVMLKYLFY
jgi:hypothetical protein